MAAFRLNLVADTIQRHSSPQDLRSCPLRRRTQESRETDKGKADQCEWEDRSVIQTLPVSSSYAHKDSGVKESDTGLAPPHLWDIAADRQRMQEEQPLQVARCTKIIQDEKDAEKSKYVINVKQIAKFVVNLGERVSPTDIEEGMRVG